MIFIHGLGGYTRGCRCNKCKAANSDYAREYYQRVLKEKRAAARRRKDAGKKRIYKKPVLVTCEKCGGLSPRKVCEICARKEKAA